MDAAREIAGTADDIRAVGARVTATLLHPALAASALRTGPRVHTALLRALTDTHGLGNAAVGPGPVQFATYLAQLTGRESLGTLTAVTSLRLRIAAVTLDHPELTREPALRRLIDAVTSDSDLESIRAFRALVKDKGAQNAMAAVSPVFTELLALRALMDENPLNDNAGWAMATGKAIDGEPLMGMGSAPIAALDQGEGSARPCEPTATEALGLAKEGSLVSFLGNIKVLATTGRIIIQSIEGPDGAVRYALSVPGMSCQGARNDTPQDFVGAWRNLFRPDSPYTRAIHKAIADYPIPAGAELALIGHSEGGIAVMNLAQDPDFCRRNKLTHVIAVGSPVDSKVPADQRTWVASITNQHDIVPSLDGRGAGACFNPHPTWYEVDFVDTTHEFPLCHGIDNYLHNVVHELHEARQDIDAALAPYRGRVIRSQVYALRDRTALPQSYPYLNVPTQKRTTTAGPIGLPILYQDTSNIVCLFRADAAAARDLLETALPGAHPVLFGDRAMVVVTGSRHGTSGIGPHKEMSVGIAVQDPFGRRSLGALVDLLRRPDLRRSGIHLLGVVSSTHAATTAAAEIWGHPTPAVDLGLTLRGGRVTAEVGDLDGHRVLSLTGRLGPALPFGPRYGEVRLTAVDGKTVRAVHDGASRMRPHPTARLRLAVGDSSQHLTGQLRSLGLDGARAWMTLSSVSGPARRWAGASIDH